MASSCCLTKGSRTRRKSCRCLSLSYHSFFCSNWFETDLVPSSSSSTNRSQIQPFSSGTASMPGNHHSNTIGQDYFWHNYHDDPRHGLRYPYATSLEIDSSSSISSAAPTSHMNGYGRTASAIPHASDGRSDNTSIVFDSSRSVPAVSRPAIYRSTVRSDHPSSVSAEATAQTGYPGPYQGNGLTMENVGALAVGATPMQRYLHQRQRNAPFALV